MAPWVQSPLLSATHRRFIFPRISRAANWRAANSFAANLFTANSLTASSLAANSLASNSLAANSLSPIHLPPIRLPPIHLPPIRVPLILRSERCTRWSSSGFSSSFVSTFGSASSRRAACICRAQMGLAMVDDRWDSMHASRRVVGTCGLCRRQLVSRLCFAGRETSVRALSMFWTF
eukprot:147863-Pleurochrysis_carterae.AAC.2